MNATPALTRTRPDLLGWTARLLTAGFLAFGAFIGGTTALLVGVRLFYSGTALPGVFVGGVDVSGMSAPEIEVALGERMSYPVTGRLALRDGSQVWTANPAQVGAVLDAPTMAAAALSVGRSGDALTQTGEQIDAWFRGVVLPPILIFDERVSADYLSTLAAQIDRPTIEAGALIRKSVV